MCGNINVKRAESLAKGPRWSAAEYEPEVKCMTLASGMTIFVG